MQNLKALSLLMLGMSLGIAVPAIAEQMPMTQFRDVPAESFFAEPVQNLFRKGIIRGYDSGEFGPDDVITRGQVATMLDRYDQEVVAPLREQIDALRKEAGLGACGDDKVQSIEQCDDGNNIDGDGCSSTCTKEVQAECFGHKLGESFIGPDGCNRCTCMEGGMACTKMFCPQPQEQKKCMSTDQCTGGLVCSTEYGDCQSACPPGAEACPAVCAGTCVPMRETNVCGDGICGVGEEYNCPPNAICINPGCPEDCSREAAMCDQAREDFAEVPKSYLTCSRDSDCTTFIQGCPFLTCGMAVNVKSEHLLQSHADKVIASCDQTTMACAKCAVRTASCVNGMCQIGSN